jgi:hypothetical protein
MKYLVAIFLLVFSRDVNAQEDFLAKPYLQIGKKVSPQSMQLVWHACGSNDTMEG